MTGTGGTGGTGGSNGVGDVLLIPESNVRLEPMDDVRGSDSGEDGRPWSLPTTYGGGAAGGSGRRLGVRIRTLREGLGAAVCLDVLPDGVGEGARLGVVRVGEVGMGGGDGVVCLGGGGEIGSAVDMPASSSFSNSGRSPLSLFRSGPGPAAPGGGSVVASRTSSVVADEPKFGDSCRISSIDPMSPLLLGATARSFSFGPFSPSVGASAEGAVLLLSLLLSLSLDARCCAVGERVRNVTLRLSRLSVNMGRYCDCGLKPDVAFRLVFSRMVSRSCCNETVSETLTRTETTKRGVPNRMRERTTSLRRCRSVRLITRPQCFHMITSKMASATPPTTPPTIAATGTDVPPPPERVGKPDCVAVPLE